MDKPPNRPRLLFICKLNPWRLNNGAIIRNYWMIHALARRFDVDVITADEADGSVPGHFADICGEIHRFPRPGGLRGKLVRAAGALRARGTFFSSGSVTRSMRAAAARLIATRSYRVIFVELAMIDAVPPGKIPLVYSAHNCEAALMLRRAALEPVWSRAAMTVDALRLRRLEARLIDRAMIVTQCSQNDVDDMLPFAPSIVQKSVIIPNGVDCATYADVARTDDDSGVILVTGSFDWLPNRRGLLWFMKEVVPLLETVLAGRHFSVRIAGRMSASLAKKLNAAAPCVTAVPNVPRMDVELRGASVVAVPVIASSGTRLRILEAWAAGRAIVTTPQGAFGLNYTNRSDLFSCSTPLHFAEGIRTLLNDGALRARLRSAGLERAAAYDWSAIGGKLISGMERFGLLAPIADQERPIVVER